MAIFNPDTKCNRAVVEQMISRSKRRRVVVRIMFEALHKTKRPLPLFQFNFKKLTNNSLRYMKELVFMMKELVGNGKS